MVIKEIQAKSILHKQKRIDSWFISRYGMNLYQGCFHNCVYCDGRAEKYYVEGDFGHEVAVKINAIDILRKELDPRRKRIPFKRSYMMIGGGVGDSYQAVEKQYHLTRKTLDLVYHTGFPVHLLTKSTLISRDLDLIRKIHRKNGAIVSFSFSSLDSEISKIFEPGVPGPDERLIVLQQFKQQGIPGGIYLLPVIPFITDSEAKMEEIIRTASEMQLEYIIFGGLTLKEGHQKNYFLKVLREHFPMLIDNYNRLYKDNKWGQASGDYYQEINRRFFRIAKKYKIPVRIPHSLYKDILDENDLVTVMLEHLDYYLKCSGKKSPFGYAAYSLSKIKEPLSIIMQDLSKISGVGKQVERMVLEILETGTSGFFESSVFNRTTDSSSIF